MGEGSAQTVREIEETRDRLETEFRELEDRLPRPAVWTKRVVGVAVGGGLGGTAFWFVARRLRGRRKAKQAGAEPIQAVINVVPERWAESVSGALEDGRWQGWLMVGGAAWLLFRLAELRQLRRMNRALVVAR
jgi:hypothetical protein